MLLVATLNNKFFRAISVINEEVEVAKETMIQDQEDLEFKIMADEEFETWLMTQ